MATILLIDDSDSIRELVSSWLIAAGHEVVALASGRGVGEWLDSKPIALIITDIYMPGVDGLEVLRLLRGKRPGIPCIAMSSAAGARDFMPVAKVLGAVATLRKPFLKEQLLLSVASAMNERVPTAFSQNPTTQSR